VKTPKRPSSTNGDYAVGYGRPPKATQFKPGQSGNPKGRPRGSKNLDTLFAVELAQPVSLTENGARRKIPKRQALVKQLVNKALSNDPKAAAVVLDQMRRSEPPAQGLPSVAMEAGWPADRRVIENIIRRIRLSEEPPQPSVNPEDADEEPK
jgi:hypothetical protein